MEISLFELAARDAVDGNSDCYWEFFTAEDRILAFSNTYLPRIEEFVGVNSFITLYIFYCININLAKLYSNRLSKIAIKHIKY